MAYTSWSVVFGEQPSAAKWNQLGTNDAGFRDGTLITNLAWNVTALSNPYKFAAYKTAAQTGIPDQTKLVFQTEDFDTNSNFDNVTNNRYTCPVSGFYQFGAGAYIASSTTYGGIGLYKNGSLFRRGGAQSSTSSGDILVTGQWFITASASDYFEIFLLVGGGATRTVYGQTDVASSRATYFEGFLVSRT